MCPVAPAKHWGDGEPGLRYLCDLGISMVGPGVSFGGLAFRTRIALPASCGQVTRGPAWLPKLERHF